MTNAPPTTVTRKPLTRAGRPPSVIIVDDQAVVTVRGEKYTFASTGRLVGPGSRDQHGTDDASYARTVVGKTGFFAT